MEAPTLPLNPSQLDPSFDAAALADIVMARCDELSACSEDKDRITRRFLTPPMHAVHERLTSWMRCASLQTRIDNAGNIVGRQNTGGSSQALILGSHLDSVPNSGRYDGVLGVLIAVAVAESLADRQLPFHLDVVGFSEEEGVRFCLPYLGSTAVTGSFQQAWLDRMDSQGTTMREVISAFKLDPNKIAEAAYSPEEVIGYVEPHLEQGPVLERAGLPVGVVSGIAGQSRLRLEFTGEVGHAGTTPMLSRSDALSMAAELIRKTRAIGRQTKGLRTTIGQLDVTPNAPNVIPGRVELSLDVRHLQDLVRERAINDILAAGKLIAKNEHGSFAMLEQNSQDAVEVDTEMSEMLSQSVRQCGHEPLQLFSGAGHDAVVMARHFPMAMLFLRHPGGISHHPDERVERDDVAVAIATLSNFVVRLATKYDESLSKPKREKV